MRDNILYTIRLKYCARMDADEEGEEHEEPKKATGWGTRLPYGLCKDLGIDTTGMTPSEAWEAYENETGKTADEMYAEKQKKGEGDVIDAENPEGDAYSGMTESELNDKLEEIKKKVDEAMDNAWSHAYDKEKSDNYIKEARELQEEQYKITSALDNLKQNESEGVETKEALEAELKKVQEKLSDYDNNKIETDWEDYYELGKKEKELMDKLGIEDKPNYSDMSQTELASELENVNNAIQKIFDESGELFTDEEMEQLDDLYEQRNEINKYFKGYDYQEPESEIPKDLEIEPMDDPLGLGEEPSDTDISSLSKGDLEYALGGSIDEFEGEGGFQKSGDGFVNPLTGEYFTAEEKEAVQKSIDNQKALGTENVGGNTPEQSNDPDDIPYGEAPVDSTQAVEELQKAINDNDADIDTFTSTLKDFGFTDEEINSDDFDNVIKKYEALGNFYDAYQDAEDWKEENNIDPNDASWFSKLSKEKQLEFYDMYEDVSKAGSKLHEFGIYDYAPSNGTVHGYDKDKVQDILQKKDMVGYYGDLLKGAKDQKAENKKKLSGLGDTVGTEQTAPSIPHVKGKNKEEAEANLKSFGFSDEEIKSENFKEVLDKYEAYNNFLNACEAEEKFLSDHGVGGAWELSDEDKEDYNPVFKKMMEAADVIEENGYGYAVNYNGSVQDETGNTIDKEKIKNIINNKELIVADAETLKASKEPPKKEYKGTIKQLQKKINSAQAEIDALKKQQLTDANGTAIPTYEDFEKFIEKGGAGDKVKTVDDFFDRAQKVTDLYDLLEEKQKKLDGFKLNGMTPDKAYEVGLLPSSERDAINDALKEVDSAIAQNQKELSEKYGYAFNDKGEPNWTSRDNMKRSLSWKDAVMKQRDKIKELQADVDGMAEAVKKKENNAKIKELNAENKKLSKDANKLKQKIDVAKGKMYKVHPTEDLEIPLGSFDDDSISFLEGQLQQALETAKNASDDNARSVIEAKLNNMQKLKKGFEEKKRIENELADINAKINENNSKITALNGGPLQNAFEASAYTQKRKDNAMWAQEPKDADNALFDKCSSVWKESSIAQKKAAYNYTTGSYDSYNDPLRDIGYGKSSGPLPKKVRDLTEMIERSSYDFDMWVQRGVGFGGASAFLGCDKELLRTGSTEDLQQLVGREPIEYGFSSTGAAKGTGMQKKVIYNIYVPRGTKALYMEPFSEFGDADFSKHWSENYLWDGDYHHSTAGYELEVLLQQGTRFRVTKAKSDYGTVYIDLEVIGQYPVK